MLPFPVWNVVFEKLFSIPTPLCNHSVVALSIVPLKRLSEAESKDIP